MAWGLEAVVWGLRFGVSGSGFHWGFGFGVRGLCLRSMTLQVGVPSWIAEKTVRKPQSCSELPNGRSSEG